MATSTLYPQIFESTVCLMCWPLNSVILLKPIVETVTRGAHTVFTAFSVLLSGVRPVLPFIMACEPTKNTECWHSKTFKRTTFLAFESDLNFVRSRATKRRNCSSFASAAKWPFMTDMRTNAN